MVERWNAVQRAMTASQNDVQAFVMTNLSKHQQMTQRCSMPAACVALHPTRAHFSFLVRVTLDDST